jgi:hypothetical protein
MGSEPLPSTLYLTRWALTEGILAWTPKEPDDVSEQNGVLVVKRWVNTPVYDDNGSHHYEPDEGPPARFPSHEWARTLEEAQANVAELARRKLTSLERRHARLRRVIETAKQAKVKDAAKSRNFEAWGLE